jgi:hypothetical protein
MYGELWTFPHHLRNVPQSRPRLIAKYWLVYVAYVLRSATSGIATVEADGTLTS